jgi:hypothetical protein
MKQIPFEDDRKKKKAKAPLADWLAGLLVWLRTG